MTALAAIVTAVVLWFPAIPASAQVVLDMPAPPRAAVQRMPRAERDAPTERVQPGELAMRRYARARVLPDHAYMPYWRNRPFVPDDFTRSWWWHGGFPVLGPPTIIFVNPKPRFHHK